METHIVPVIFLLNTLKGTKITLPVVILYYSTLSGTNQQILTPKRYNQHPPHIYRGVPPGHSPTNPASGNFCRTHWQVWRLHIQHQCFLWWSVKDRKAEWELIDAAWAIKPQTGIKICCTFGHILEQIIFFCPFDFLFGHIINVLLAELTVGLYGRILTKVCTGDLGQDSPGLITDLPLG